MKQTAVDYLLSELQNVIELYKTEWEELDSIVKKAREMEWEQMFKCKGNNDNGCFMESPGHDCGCFERIQQEEPKQETIKKAAKSYRSSTANKMAIEQQAFQEGAKWQAERMYSEEDVYHILCEHTAFLFMGGKSTLTEWFEKYKKK